MLHLLGHPFDLADPSVPQLGTAQRRRYAAWATRTAHRAALTEAAGRGHSPVAIGRRRRISAIIVRLPWRVGRPA